MQLRRKAPHVVRLRVAQRQRDLCGEPLEPVERLAVERERARGEASLDPEVVEMAGDVGVARARRRVVGGAAAHAGGSSRVSAALATSPMRGEEVGAHVGAVARRVGRREDEQAERDELALVAQRHERERRRLAGIVEPLHRLESGVDAAIRAPAGCSRSSSRPHSTGRVKGRPANTSAAPQTRTAACGIRNWCCSSTDEHVRQVGGVGGQHQRARPAVQLVGDRDVVLAVADHLRRSAAPAL